MNSAVRRMVSVSVIFTSLLFGQANWAIAQETQRKMSPEEAQAMMEQTVPGVVRMMLLVLLEFYADPRSAEMEAAHARNLYDALQKKGFSKEEALAIVVGYGNPVRLDSGN